MGDHPLRKCVNRKRQRDAKAYQQRHGCSYNAALRAVEKVHSRQADHLEEQSSIESTPATNTPPRHQLIKHFKIIGNLYGSIEPGIPAELLISLHDLAKVHKSFMQKCSNQPRLFGYQGGGVGRSYRYNLLEFDSVFTYQPKPCNALKAGCSQMATLAEP